MSQAEMLAEIKAVIYRALEEPGADQQKLALNAMAFVSGIAGAILSETKGRKVSAEDLLNAVFRSEIIGRGIARMNDGGLQ